MKKASNILYLVGSILCFVAAGSFLIVGLVFTILGGLQIFNQDTTATPEQIEAANLTFLLVGAISLVMIFPTIVGGVVGFRARRYAYPGNRQKGLHITAIVFGAISGEYILIAGAVLGVILSNRKPIENERIKDAEIVE